MSYNPNPLVVVDLQANISRYNDSPIGSFFIASDTGQGYIRVNNAFGFSGGSSFIPLRQAGTSSSILTTGTNPTLTALTLPEIVIIAPANAVVLPAATAVRGAITVFYRTAAAGAITVAAAGGNTIDGGANITLANDGSVHAQTLFMPTAGTDWKTLSKY